MKISGSGLVAEGGVADFSLFFWRMYRHSSRSESPCVQVPQYGQRIGICSGLRLQVGLYPAMDPDP